MSAVKPRLAVGFHIWPNPEFFNEAVADSKISEFLSSER